MLNVTCAFTSVMFHFVISGNVSKSKRGVLDGRLCSHLSVLVSENIILSYFALKSRYST